MNIISIDFSKVRTGLLLSLNGEYKSMKISNAPKVAQEKAMYLIYTGLKTILELYKFDLGLIEGYGFNPKNKRSMIPMSEIGGVIKMLFYELRIPLVTIHIQTWKSLTIGRISKIKEREKYEQAAFDKYGKRFNTIDELDAFLIYQGVLAVTTRTTNLTESMVKIKCQIQNIIGEKELLEK